MEDCFNKLEDTNLFHTDGKREDCFIGTGWATRLDENIFFMVIMVIGSEV